MVENPAIKGIEIIAVADPNPNELLASTNQIDFGSVAIDELGSRDFTLTNNGGSNDPPITIDPGAATILATSSQAAQAESPAYSSATNVHSGSNSTEAGTETQLQYNNTATGGDTSSTTEPDSGTTFSGYMSETNPVTGDFQVVANIQNLVSNGARPEVGILIQEPSTGATRFVQLGIQLDGRYYQRSLSDVNGQLVEKDTGMTGQFPNVWVLIERVGDELTIAVSNDDAQYQLIEVITIPGLSDTLEAGIYIDSGSENVEATATMQGFDVIPLP